MQRVGDWRWSGTGRITSGGPPVRNRDGRSAVIVSGDRQVDYADLERIVAKAAAGFAGFGVREGDAIALMLRNDIAFFEAAAARERDRRQRGADQLAFEGGGSRLHPARLRRAGPGVPRGPAGADCERVPARSADHRRRNAPRSPAARTSYSLRPGRRRATRCDGPTGSRRNRRWQVRSSAAAR